MSKFVRSIVAGVVLCLSVTAAHAQVVAAKFTGPIPVTAQSGEPYRGNNEQPVPGPGMLLPILTPYGYMEEEYFVSGTVNGQPYVTSMLVRRPKDPRKFSGLVAVETVHAAGAIPLWGLKDIWLGGGHAWVGVASQLAGLENNVRKSNPRRYASLKVPQAPAPANPPQGGGGEQDLISQAIMTQVGALLKSNPPNGPFRGTKVKWLIMGGSSQTGGTTLRYIQNSHAAARMPDGSVIYNGYLPWLSFPSTPVSAEGAPIMHVVTEGDLVNSLASGRVPVLREDSDAPKDRYRFYEIPGASHVGLRGYSDPKQVSPNLGSVFKPGEELSQFPSSDLMVPMAQHLVDWVIKGKAPARAPRIEMANGQIVRDANGNAKGGLRSPYVDLATVRYIASAPASRLMGLQEPIPIERLRAMYKSKQNYLQQFDRQIDKMVAGGWIFAKQGAKLKAEERENPHVKAL